MPAPSAVQALCPWVIRVQRPVSLETNLSGSVPNTFTQCITLKRISKEEKCCAPQICHSQRWPDQGSKKEPPQRSPGNTVQNPSALKVQRSLPSGKGSNQKRPGKKYRIQSSLYF